MESIEAHIKKDQEILADPTTSPAARRHYKEELHELEVYEEHHHDEIVAEIITILMLLNCSVRCTQMNQNA